MRPARDCDIEPDRRGLLIQQFDAHRPRILSLDVFDTLLLRPFEEPTDIFVEVYKDLCDFADRPPAKTADLFAALRKDSEKRARREEPTGEVTIHEIASVLAATSGTGIPVDVLVEAEVETEGKFIQVDLDVVALIEHAASQGIPYVLVSDMYLLSDHLLNLFQQACRSAQVTVPPPARIFVSCEYRANKGGSLFKNVIAELDVPNDAIFHVGDNYKSDVESPQRFGIRSFFYQRANNYIDDVLQREQPYRMQATAQAALHVRNDLGLHTSRCKALMCTQGDGLLSHRGYGSFILGPVLTLFADWVVEDCMRRGNAAVYCLMREGAFLSSLINMAAEERGISLCARPMWASRYALRAASYRGVTDVELRAWFQKRRRLPLQSLARDLGLDTAHLRSLTGIRHDAPLTKGDAEKVIAAVINNRETRKSIQMRSAACRERLIQYYDSIGLLDTPSCTVVDLGWGGSIQKMLANLLRDHKESQHIRGLYFATNATARNMPLTSCSVASFLWDCGQPRAGFDVIQRTPELIEQACMPEEGSFVGISESGEVETFQQLIPPAQVRQILEIQAGVLDFAKRWLPGAAKRRARLTHAEWEHILARLRAILIRSIDDPTLEEVRLFEDWVHDDNDGSACSDFLIGSPSLRQRARGMSYRRLLALSWLECFWPQGLACLAGVRRTRNLPDVRWPQTFAHLFRLFRK